MTTNEIIIAVQESQPVPEEDLRLALLVLNYINHFIKQDLQKLIECVERGRDAKWRAEFAKGTLDRTFQAAKKPPKEWLGPADIPGTAEYERRYNMAKTILKRVMDNAI